MPISDFIKDSVRIDAVLMNIIVIGEAVNRLTEDFREKNSGVDWFRIRGLRNRVAHDYSGVDAELIWEITQTNLPFLKSYLEKIT